MRPFLKWAGSKYRSLEVIKKNLPKSTRLIEPFAGSASVFLNTEYDRYLLAEINPDLINLYLLLQEEGKKFINYLKKLFVTENNSKEKYYKFREEFNSTYDIRKKSALFLYMNKHGYNGLCRYNSTGGFNVPFGYYKNIYFPEKELTYFHQRSRKAEFILSDFTETMMKAEKGDVVYCDPPYVPLSKTAKFTEYSVNAFTEAQQIQLVKCAEQLAMLGVTVVISNHDTEFVRKLYKKSTLHSLSVPRLIGSQSQRRGPAKEILAIFHHH